MPRIPFKIQPDEMQISAIRAQGPGGQNINKVSSAVHLRFSIPQSSLPQILKDRLFQHADPRITEKGDILIKAQEFRTQEQNRADACEKLLCLLNLVATIPKKRKPTTPTKASKRRRLDQKGKRGEIKRQRQIRE